MFTKVVMVLFGIKEILREFRFALNNAKKFWLDDGRPKARTAADGAVATVGALRQIDLGFEFDRSAVATSMVGF